MGASFANQLRLDLVDLLSIYSAVDQIGVHRVGIADTVGVSLNGLPYTANHFTNGI